MEKDINAEILIPLVQSRPLLWDRAHENYKDRDATKEAWEDICTEMNNNYGTYEPDEKLIYSKAVLKRWVNIRDSYHKCLKKEKQHKKFGTTGSTSKKYVYASQLKFLDTIFTPQSTKNRATAKTEITTSDDDYQENVKTESKTPPPRKEVVSRKKTINDVEMQPVNTLLIPEDRHISFFRGIVPSLHTFTEDETLTFQMRVLQIISDIKHSRIQSQ